MYFEQITERTPFTWKNLKHYYKREVIYAKMFLVLMILLLTNNICNAAIYKNIENEFSWSISAITGTFQNQETPGRRYVLIFTASDDKKSTVRVGVSPVIDEKENATLRNMPKELLNEYFDAFIGMTKQASSNIISLSPTVKI